MNTWLYQMSEKRWSRKEFLKAVREGKKPIWYHRKIVGEGTPSKDDRVILFYARTVSKVPGICGVGVIRDYDPDEETITLKVVAPTDLLRVEPWWDSSARKITDDLRGGGVRATLFFVTKDYAAKLHAGIKKWIA